MRGIFRRACLAAGILVGGLALVAPAQGHDWYSDTGCCGGEDCRIVDAGEIEFTTTETGADAWLVVETGEVIPADETRPSPDGQNHRCEYLAGKLTGMTRKTRGIAGVLRYCLWVGKGNY